ncbi:COG4705 family protein [Lysobacter xanthus]
MRDHDPRGTMAKVPAITLGFWIIKILATTLGEVGGDAVTMSWLGETTPDARASGISGYLVGTVIFATIFAAVLALQIRARSFRPWLYWATIVASTTVGTTLADFVTRALGIGYRGGSMLLLGLLLASLLAWRRATGTIAVASVRTPRAELFYWLTITLSQTLGTALGDWVADTRGLGYVGGMAIFGGLLAIVAALRFTTALSRTALFWSAFVLTRPLGAVVGDFLDKSHAQGGLELSRYTGSIVLLIAIALCVALLPQRPAAASH